MSRVVRINTKSKFTGDPGRPDTCRYERSKSMAPKLSKRLLKVEGAGKMSDVDR